MQVTIIACPKCAKSLKLTQALPTGAKVRCTGCGQPFALPNQVRVIAAPLVATSVETSHGEPTGRGSVLVMLVLAMLLLGGAATGLALYLNREKDKGGSPDNRNASVDKKTGDQDRPKDDEPPLKKKEVEKESNPNSTNDKDPPNKHKPEETTLRPNEFDPRQPAKPDPIKPDPIKPDPVKPDPMKPDPVKPDPVKPDPVKPDPMKPDPMKPDPMVKLVDGSLSREDQEKVNVAIDKGVSYLKSIQTADGSWPEIPRFAALPGLVLLECGVPATDEVIIKTAKNVRDRVPKLDCTYDVSIAILFLDRLGDPEDRPLIQSLALRLIASQSRAGGWTYVARGPEKPEVEAAFLKALVLTRPKNNLELFVESPDGRLSARLLGIKPNLVPNLRLDPDAPLRNPEARVLIASLPVTYLSTPALQTPSSMFSPQLDIIGSDHSNTQFAMLALLAAARHDVPIERTLAFAARRFRLQQESGGGWTYRSIVGSTPAMTCAGLLGLAVGHGLMATAKPAIQGVKPSDDPGLQAGLRFVARSIGKPLDPTSKEGSPEWNQRSLYFLWSMERVGVLYNLHKIDGKDWYAWGVDMLLKDQKAGGYWYYGNYAGTSMTVDTCLSLLFLKRVNLAKELTIKINKFELIGEDKPPK